MSAEEILVDRQERVLTITLNRPEARNALNSALLSRLIAELEKGGADPEVGVIVLTGTGDAFCAGADLKEVARTMDDADPFTTAYDRSNQSMRVHQMLPRLPKPVIAAVNGTAVAGGCGLAMSCDLVIAAQSARFGYPEVNRGLVAAMVMVSLSRVIGRRQALDLLLSGRFVPAQEALALGMINQVVPDTELASHVMAYAHEIAAKPATALRFTKDLYRQVVELDYDRAIEYARDINLMIRQTGAAREGAAAFVAGQASTKEKT
jgi:enoyl-CoA hydratase/carnithine racemase